MTPIRPKTARLRLDPASYETLRQQVLRRITGDANRAAQWRSWKSITNNFGAIWEMTPKRT